MFERFDPAARGVVVHAQENAVRLQHQEIGTQHLLLGLYDVRPSTGSAQILLDHGLDRETVEAAARDAAGPGPDDLDAQALAAVGIDLAAVRERVEATFGPGALDRPVTRSKRRRRVTGHIPFTASAKKNLELALREAQRLGHTSIRDEHVLLAMIRDQHNAARAVIAGAGIDLATLREDVEARMNPGRSATG